MELETVFDDFAAAAEAQLLRMADDIRTLRAELQTRAAAIGPQGERGIPGEPGETGPVGPQGERGAPGVAIAGPPGERGERGPQGERGADGIQGRDGAPGRDGADGEQGQRGADGLAGRDGAASTVPGPRGEQGERGTDGIATLADLDARIEERFAEFQVRTFADTYQGVYETNRMYMRGTVTTWGGSLWLSQVDTGTKPGETSAWKLIVKAGRDGKK